MSSLLNRSQLLSKANLIMESPMNIVNTLYNGWDYAFDLLHDNPAQRQELLEIIDTNGVELFQLNQVLTNFMINQLSGVRNDIVSHIELKLSALPNFIYNQDGSVSEVIVTVPTTDSVVYGTPLSSVDLTGGSATIPGSFTFVTPSLIPNAGINNYSINFVPTDLVNFKTTTHTITLSVVPAQLPTVNFNPPSSLVYDGEPKSIEVSVQGPNSLTLSYTGRNDTFYGDSLPPTETGDYTLTVTSNDPNYTGSSNYNFSILPSV